MGIPLGKVNSVFFAIFQAASFFFYYIPFVFELVLAENTELIYEIYSIYPMPGDKVPV